MSVIREESKKLERAKEAILALLGANDGAPITGKTVLIKQVFIMAKEIAPEIDPALEFYPYQIGPYSSVLAKLLNEWIKKGIIHANKDGRDWVFSLSEKGQQYFCEMTGKLSPKQFEQIEKMKSSTAEWGTKGILNYVYERYPEYAVADGGEVVGG
jgi:uncharacterized protein YwgA